MRFRFRHIVLILVCSACLVRGQASAAIFGYDNRARPDPRSDHLYDSIGLVESESSRATGTIISPCLAVTAQHVIQFKGPVLNSRVRFTAGLATHRPLITGATVIAAGGYERFSYGSDSAEARAADWALLRLDQCLGRVVGFADLVSGEPVAVDGKLASAGFPASKLAHRGPLIDPDCSITSVRPLVWKNDCAAVPGDSGGPIFQVSRPTATRPAHLRVYAMQSAGIHTSKPIPYVRGWDNEATPAWVILGHVGMLILSDTVAIPGNLDGAWWPNGPVRSLISFVSGRTPGAYTPFNQDVFASRQVGAVSKASIRSSLSHGNDN